MKMREGIRGSASSSVCVPLLVCKPLVSDDKRIKDGTGMPSTAMTVEFEVAFEEEEAAADKDEVVVDEDDAATLRNVRFRDIL